MCDLCGGNAGPYGNNPGPLRGDTCCDTCNMTKVMPARLTRNESVRLMAIMDSAYAVTYYTIKARGGSEKEAKQSAEISRKNAVKTMVQLSMD